MRDAGIVDGDIEAAVGVGRLGDKAAMR